ncbi:MULTISPECIES: ParM/StbA family protein [Calothrix]|uniref:ParM/StbA family protein n=2 Tax=Calothrix TaxID=1186 RepID=A0ABR8AKI2_9CYAN|nr:MULTISPECIES: ParM/StbA family protein [Calothrix]MBD2200537.1 ParM/StbA family protein [Calothrix parietina FACHB-288]MBD2229571.1 ParM/StbA family protein [Calothrix anomala FACHB-343]
MSKTTQQKNHSSQELILALDFGGSATKGIYCTLKQNIPASLVMEPEVVKISLDSVTIETLGTSEPENAAWVNYMGEIFAVGYLAKNKYYANEGLRELKYERAVAKTLASIWSTSQKLQLGTKFRLALVCLLPPGEFENKESFHKHLKTVLADFTTPTGRMRVELTQFKCLPEGAGIYLAYQKQIGQAIKTKAIALVMVGYRNASMLISDKGIVAADGKTSDLGMIRLLEKVVARTSGQTASQLAPAVVAAGSDISSTPFLRLLRSTNNINKQQELLQIQKAVKLARSEYAAVLTSWLDQVISRSGVDEILFCGGTADYMRRELNSHYPGTPCLWGVGTDIPKQVDSFGLGSRLADVYSVFLYFWEQVNKQLEIC